MNRLSHINEEGKVRMVNIESKEVTHRRASASITVVLNQATYALVIENKGPKGDVLAVANLAGIQAAKRTSELIPLCHQIPLNQVVIEFELDDEKNSVIVTSEVSCLARTGVEMEALTACSVAALTVYDMLKAVQKDISITNLNLLKKSGGKSGDYKNRNL